MAYKEKKAPHTPPEKQAMKHILEDTDKVNDNKKSRNNNGAVTALSEEDIYIINDEKCVSMQHYTNIKQWFDLAKETINNQKVVIKNLEKSVSAQQKDTIKLLITKREKYLQKIDEIDEEIRAIEKDINEDNESKEGNE